MSFDFDQTINREGFHSVKFDGRQQYFGTTDVAPMWVADMDFAVPDCIQQALVARASHPILGYTLYPESLYQSLINWFQRRHNWTIEREWILMAPGVVPSLYACCTALAGEDDGVIVQPPVYFPFFSAVKDTHRTLILNPLRETNGRYEIDFIQLELLAPQATLILLCTPHNPVGRVWSRAELLQLLRIAKNHNLIILSDDIHADLIYPGKTHTMLGTLGSDDGELNDFIHTNVITAVAPSKTFNIPGLGLSSLIVPNPNHRRALERAFGSLHISNNNPFSIAAYEAAYNGGDAWLDALMIYLQENTNFVRSFLQNYIPQIRLVEPEGTYLLWLDCTGLGLNDSALRDFFIQRCKLGLSPGVVFGEGGSGFMRMNIGTPLEKIKVALESIHSALHVK